MQFGANGCKFMQIRMRAVNQKAVPIICPHFQEWSWEEG